VENPCKLKDGKSKGRGNIFLNFPRIIGFQFGSSKAIFEIYIYNISGTDVREKITFF